MPQISYQSTEDSQTEQSRALLVKQEYVAGASHAEAGEEDHEEDEYGEDGKKKSKAKFNAAAVKLLVEKVREHKDVVLSKETTADMIAFRRETWADITLQVSVPVEFRDIFNCRKLWSGPPWGFSREF